MGTNFRLDPSATRLGMGRVEGAELAPSERTAVVDTDVMIRADRLDLPGHLTVPPDCVGLVIFAHGCASGHMCPGDRVVADHLHGRGLATLLFDMFSRAEVVEHANVCATELLSKRMQITTRWARRHPACAGLEVGYFAVGDEAGAALCAAGEDPTVRAVVSLRGRPDLAGPDLGAVRAPVLLIVGSEDPVRRAVNEEAAARIRCPHELAVVPGASHLFDEAGTLESASHLASQWFVRHLDHTPAPSVHPH